jgi:hypothetical protein
MEVFLEILKYTLPALVVFFTTFLFLRAWTRGEEKRMRHEKQMEMKDDILPVRLQAYERIILFLERIAPESILVRLNRTGMSAQQLQNELMNTIRHEYEHNISQQTYISNEAWHRVQTARNQVQKLISDAAAELKEGASGSTLGKRILEKVMELKVPPSQAAIAFLKQEVQELFLN